MSYLQEAFPEELSILKKLFTSSEIDACIDRLNEIHEYTEKKWVDYVKRIPNGRVNYLLIAEAPPWKEIGKKIEYVLDPTSSSRMLMTPLREAFDIPKSMRKDTDSTLSVLARKGVIVIDSIPFAMSYSKMRSRVAYGTLINESVKPYLKSKLDDPRISWHPNIRVALAFKGNGQKVISALGGRLQLGETSVSLNSQSIVGFRRGFSNLSAKRLIDIFGLDSYI